MSDTQSPEELPELEELDVPPLPAGEPARAVGGPRQLEKAPLMLRKAALILAVSALLPWFKPGGFDLAVVGAKVVILLGALLCYWGILAAHGQKAPGFVGSLAKSNPKLPGWIGYAILLVGVLPVIDLPFSAPGLLEKATLAIGALVWLQVLAYEMGGKFNPIGGLLIPMLGLAGLGRLITVFAAFDVFALLGSLGVAAAGGLAGYTMFVAFKEAKAHGEAKKKAAVEQRKAARAAQRDKK